MKKPVLSTIVVSVCALCTMPVYSSNTSALYAKLNNAMSPNYITVAAQNGKLKNIPRTFCAMFKLNC